MLQAVALISEDNNSLIFYRISNVIGCILPVNDLATPISHNRTVKCRMEVPLRQSAGWVMALDITRKYNRTPLSVNISLLYDCNIL